MAKRREIKFRRENGDLTGRQNGIKFYIFHHESLEAAGEPAYTVGFRTGYGGSSSDCDRTYVSTGGYQQFTLEGAMEFCQQIAAGEITVEDVLATQAAQDTAKEQAAVKAITARAKKFRDRLEAKGLTYMDLLELEAIHKGLGDIGHNILLGWYHGEGLPHG